MRKLVQKRKIESRGLDTTPYGLQHAADFLDNEKTLHIETLYFTADGEYWLNCFEHKGKFYARLRYVPVVHKIGGQNKTIYEYEADEKYAIVKALDAQEIVEMVAEWRENEAEIIYEPDPENPQRTIKKWINKPGAKSEEVPETTSGKNQKKMTKKEKIDLLLNNKK